MSIHFLQTIIQFIINFNNLPIQSTMFYLQFLAPTMKLIE